MANFNLRYECLDARDDYRAEMLQEVADELPAWMSHNTYAELVSEGNQHLILEDMADYGIDADLIANPARHGKRRKARERQAAVIRDMMGPRGCNWSSAKPDLADFSRVHFDVSISDKNPSEWKDAVQTTRRSLLDSRHSQDADMQQNKHKKDSRYVDQVEIINKRHLVRGQHDDTEESIVSKVSSEFGLNSEQERIFRIVTQHADNPVAIQLRMYVGGMGGTGKTRVLNALTSYFKAQGESRRLVVVVPTGTAAALINGSTYHFMFGINECNSDSISKKSLAEVKGRLQGVDYMFLDEVSMLSCVDLYKISARLAMCLNKPELPFGGMNMIFAGDFAQLPPAIGGERASLYGPTDGIFASNRKSQEMAMGKAIWHQVTTVVILRQNMRQQSQTPEDDKLRGALAQMRYKVCTKMDIAFLNSWVTSRPKAPKITDKDFRNVAIITGLNVHKDEFNRIASARYAQETGQELTIFFSDDNISSSETDVRPARGVGTRNMITSISPSLQDILWAALPSENDKHIPATLALCKGMPVMIRVNSATELCMTKGQEGTMYAWKEGIGSRGQRVLATLFVKLNNPPTEVNIPGLPANVVPLIRSSVTINCHLPDDTTLCIACSQVKLLLNFAMTDFSSQGKTRPFNPVDLNNCRSHQSYYTALSRTATAAGTLILPPPGNVRCSPVDPRKIQGGCSGYLRQEFRELELLDDITTQLYHDMLPMSVLGDTRYSLIDTYREYVGAAYTPPVMDPALQWSDAVPFDMEDATDLRAWSKTIISHKPLPPLLLKKLEPPTTAVDIKPISRMFTPMKPSEKRKDRVSDTFDAKQVTADKHSVINVPGCISDRAHMDPPMERPIGCKWSNNSCPFDSSIFVLYNMWRINPAVWSYEFRSYGNTWLDLLAESFNKHLIGLYTLEEVRDYVRRKMHRAFPGVFVFGQETSVEAVMMRWVTHQHAFSEVDVTCRVGHVGSQSSQYSCTVEPGSTGRLPWSTLQQYIDNTSATPLTFAGSQCSTCGTPTSQSRTYKVAPPFIAVMSAFTRAPPDPSIRITASGDQTEYRLAGVVYYGTHHFTAQYVDTQDRVWFNDGISLGRRAESEGFLCDVDMSKDKGSKGRDVFIYRRADL
ncbi:uncharacterized protein ARMOST_09170 [Armillaria ostoyae]|uniref:ATP-dependent DNA helicase n=1 Tax=Armillaria ostoyae TaxID=47428 RepID=A0A284RAT4_ARMOS|nr:uncharacterized protein ARMOST_09170 [Armillaria ostoyae]